MAEYNRVHAALNGAIVSWRGGSFPRNGHHFVQQFVNPGLLASQAWYSSMRSARSGWNKSWTTISGRRLLALKYL
jgi:hypothetical protein